MKRRIIELTIIVFINFSGCVINITSCCESRIQKNPSIIKEDEVTSVVDNYVNTLSTSVCDGTAYGCDLICWIDGFGFCYNITTEKSMKYEIVFRMKESSDTSTVYYVILQNVNSDSEQYTIGELRVKNDLSIGLYGVPYLLDVWRCESVELKPIWIGRGLIQYCINRTVDVSKVGVIREFDIARQEVTISLGELEDDPENEYPEYVNRETIMEETIRLRLNSDTLIIIWGEDMEVIVSVNNFFQMLDAGYLGPYDSKEGYYPVGFYFEYNNDQLVYCRELYET